MTDQIQAAAASLAACEEALEAANAEHQKRIEEAALIDKRFLDKQSERYQALLAARDTPNDNVALGRLSMFDADLEDLSHLLAEAKRVAAESEPVRQREDVQRAQHHLQQAKDLAAYEALGDHVAAAEHALCRAIGRRHEIGVRLGRPRELSHHWRPTPEFHSMVSNRVPPKP